MHATASRYQRSDILLKSYYATVWLRISVRSVRLLPLPPEEQAFNIIRRLKVAKAAATDSGLHQPSQESRRQNSQHAAVGTAALSARNLTLQTSGMAIHPDPEKAVISHKHFDRPGSPSSTTNDDNISNESDSTADLEEAGTVLADHEADTKFEAIRPATGVSATGADASGGLVARTRSNKSLRSLRSISHTRSNNGYGCDDLADDDDDGDGNDNESPSSSSDPKSGGRDEATGGKDPFEVQFDRGTDDPWNPRSMSTLRKWLIVALSSSGSFCVTCASSIYTSTYAQMNAEFNCSKLIATLGLSTFVLGIALGPMWSPLSEFYGRRPIYLFAFAAFTIFIVPCAVAKNIETVIVTRFFQGLSGSAFLSVSGGTVGDLFRPERMHHPMTLFTAAPFLAPSMGPLIGGFINSNVNWRWTHYILIIWASLMFLAIFFLVPETYRKCCRRVDLKAPVRWAVVARDFC